ncbi:RNA polymerase sigma factor [Lentzea sp. NPDC051838]|uniref:RNA polymerase sigma factor n=1 Tax=Lentzea sp. NPDC051838 TaxID=3154849 RepID=UPI003440F10A
MNTVSGREEFADWVSPHLTAMARLAARLAPDADRDDVVQDALVRAWLKRHQFDERRGTPSAWLLAITADQAGKARTRTGRRLTAVPDVPASKDHEDGLDLRRALERLTARQRLAVDCVYFVGLTVVETAAVMRCAEGTVKSTLADARAKLRVLLEVAG